MIFIYDGHQAQYPKPHPVTCPTSPHTSITDAHATPVPTASTPPVSVTTNVVYYGSMSMKQWQQWVMIIIQQW